MEISINLSDKFHGKSLKKKSWEIFPSLCFWQFLFFLCCDISDYFDFWTYQLTPRSLFVSLLLNRMELSTWKTINCEKIILIWSLKIFRIFPKIHITLRLETRSSMKMYRKIFSIFNLPKYSKTKAHDTSWARNTRPEQWETGKRCKKNSQCEMWINFTLINDCSLFQRRKNINEQQRLAGRREKKCYYFSWLQWVVQEGGKWKEENEIKRSKQIGVKIFSCLLLVE